MSFWLLWELGGGHHGEGGAVAEGGARVHGLGAVWRQDTPVFPQAARDRQPSLVSHGFGEGKLEREAGREEAESEHKLQRLREAISKYVNHTVTSQ